MSGDLTKINSELSINAQAKAIKYNAKLEIDRSNFVVRKMLGAGNFGCVYEGTYNTYFLVKQKSIV